MAELLAPYFEQVVGTDISAKQLAEAPQLPNVTFRVEQAEHSTFADHSVDLIVVAQAVHWFQFEDFYAEVRRVLRPGGMIALIGYPLFTTPNAALNHLIQHFYTNIVGPYWDKERRHLDARYTTIPFPFQEIHFPDFQMQYHWTAEQLLGYLSTWSAVQHYIKAHGVDPVEAISAEIRTLLPEAQTAEINFELLCRVGTL
jgi:SAM-dependent methyltransferase